MTLQIIFYIAMLFGGSNFDADEMMGQAEGESGREEQFYSIEFLDANITEIRTEMLNNKYSENMQHQSRLPGRQVSNFIQSMINSPRDTSSGLPTGKRQHKPYYSTGQ